MPQDLRVSIVVRTLMGYRSMDTPAISLLVQPQFPYWMEIKLFTSVIFLRLRNLDLIDLTDFISLCCDSVLSQDLIKSSFRLIFLLSIVPKTRNLIQVNFLSADMMLQATWRQFEFWFHLHLWFWFIMVRISIRSSVHNDLNFQLSTRMLQR